MPKECFLTAVNVSSCRALGPGHMPTQGTCPQVQDQKEATGHQDDLDLYIIYIRSQMPWSVTFLQDLTRDMTPNPSSRHILFLFQ